MKLYHTHNTQCFFSDEKMNLKSTQRLLMANFLFMVMLTVLLVALYETGLVEPLDMSVESPLVFVLQVTMELATIVAIPLALKLFSFKAVRRRLVRGKGDALLPWGTARLNMLCLPMVANVFLYYQTMSPAFGYMGIILFLCLFFIYPSIGRCAEETEGGEKPRMEE